jgi:hypothetical protein
MKLQSRGALLRVDFSVSFASFSFEGYISEVDDSALVIEGRGDRNSPSLTLSGLLVSAFDGDFREDDPASESGELYLSLAITRPVAPNFSNDVFIFHISGGWPMEQRRVM